MPVSGLLSMFMRMVVERKFIPEFSISKPDNIRTDELDAISKKGWEDFNEGKTIPLAVVLRDE